MNPNRALVSTTMPVEVAAFFFAFSVVRFLGLPVRRTSNITDLIEAVVGVCTDTRTGLILVDELHNISLTIAH